MTTPNASFFHMFAAADAVAGKCRQTQSTTTRDEREHVCVCACVVFLCVLCYSVRKIRSLLLILFSVTTSANEWRSRREIIRLAILAIA